MSQSEPELRAALAALVAEAAEEPFTDDQRTRWNTLNEQIDEYQTRRDRLRELAADPRHRESPIDEAPAYRETNATRSLALRSNEAAALLPEAAREKMEEQIRADDDPRGSLAQATVALADRAYLRAFSKWARDPISGGHEWTQAERDAVQRVRFVQRAMSLGSTTAGGFLVPYELDPAINIASAGAVSPLREIARTVITAQNEKRLVTSLGVTASWDNEAEEASDDSPALLQPTITCKKGAAFVPVSYELLEDSDIATQVATLFADAKAVHESLSFTLTQSQGPVGLISALVASGTAVAVVNTGSSALATSDLYANQAALPARWRPNAKWMMNLTVLNGYRQLPQATGLNYSIVSDAGPVPSALGWEIHENSSMGTLTAGTADYALVSGDFQQYAIVDRLGSTVVPIPALFGSSQRPTGQAGFYLHWRTGADVLIPAAFRLSNFNA